MDEAREGARLAFFLTGGISGRRGGGAQEEHGVEECCWRSSSPATAARGKSSDDLVRGKERPRSRGQRFAGGTATA